MPASSSAAEHLQAQVPQSLSEQSATESAPPSGICSSACSLAAESERARSEGRRVSASLQMPLLLVCEASTSSNLSSCSLMTPTASHLLPTNPRFLRCSKANNRHKMQRPCSLATRPSKTCSAAEQKDPKKQATSKVHTI